MPEAGASWRRTDSALGPTRLLGISMFKAGPLRSPGADGDGAPIERAGGADGAPPSGTFAGVAVGAGA